MIPTSAFDDNRLENNGVEFFKGKMINGSAWKTHDHDWVVARQAEWDSGIRPKMEYLETPKRKLKQYEEYFVRGRLPKAHPWEEEPAICMFYLIWWHPDDSDGNWEEIRATMHHVGHDATFDGSPVFWRNHYDISEREFMLGAGSWGNMTPAEGFPGAFMDGAEERMLNFLIAVEEIECHKMIYKVNPTLWLRNPDDRNANPHALYQYDTFLNRWRECLASGAHDKYLDRERDAPYIADFFRAVADFPFDQRPPEHFKSVFARKVKDILDSGPLSDPYRQLWEKTKREIQV